MSVRICKCCLQAECCECGANYGEVKPGGIEGLSACGHDRDWVIYLCTDCGGYFTEKDFTSFEEITKMLEGGCKNGYHQFAGDMELPLQLTQYPGAERAEIEGFKCIVCGCIGHIPITAKSVHWMDKAEIESIEQHMFSDDT